MSFFKSFKTGSVCAGKEDAGFMSPGKLTIHCPGANSDSQRNTHEEGPECANTDRSGEVLGRLSWTYTS